MRCDCEAMGLVSNPLNEVKPLRSARKQDRIRFERTEKFFLPLRQSDDGNPPEEVELTEDLDRASELSLTAVRIYLDLLFAYSGKKELRVKI